MDIEDEEAKFEELAREEMERRFSEADEKYMGMLEEYVASGFCETLARITIYLGKERAEKVLGKLPEEIRTEIEKRIDALDDKTRTDKKNYLLAKQVLENAGVCDKMMADSVIKGAEQAVLVALYNESDALFNRNPVLERSIASNIFLFADIVFLDDMAIQRVLQKVNIRTLAKALKGNNTELAREKIFRNKSSRAVDMLKEEIEYMGPIRLHDVLDAQAEIIEIIKQMEKSGEIVIARFGEDAFAFV